MSVRADCGHELDAAPVITAGPLRIDTAARKVTLDGAPLALTPRQYDVLAFLASSPGRFFTTDEIVEGVFGYATRSTAYQYAFQLRRALGPGWITNRQRLGYTLRVAA